MKNAPSFLSFHPAGWPFMALAAGITALLFFVSETVFFFGIIITAWCFYFFRDPARVTPTRPGLIVSPADGKIVAIQDVVPDASFGLGSDPLTRISIFLNVFDVHVNRIPAEGAIVIRNYRPGKFFNASLDKASVDNERMSLTIKLEGAHAKAGQLMGVVQIAGLIARRIVCDAQEGQQFKTGARFGIIRFGSRADIYQPAGVVPLVAIGQYMLGGETILADCSGTESARVGEIRT